jgi:hypothetical protein
MTYWLGKKEETGGFWNVRDGGRGCDWPRRKAVGAKGEMREKEDGGRQLRGNLRRNA